MLRSASYNTSFSSLRSVCNVTCTNRHRFPAAAFLFLVLGLSIVPFDQLRGQTLPGQKSGTMDDPIGRSGTERLPDMESSDNLPALEAPVNPATYRVGPYDQFLLSLPPFPAPFALVIGPDNRLMLPRDFPSIDVGRMTLQELREKVEGLYRARTPAARNVSLALRNARPIRVRVIGDVLVPGPLTLTAADRVSTAIDLANIPSKNLPSRQIDALIEQQSERMRVGTGVSSNDLRFVVVRHNDGTTSDVDITRWRYLGDDSQNPTLREGDEIVVTQRNQFSPTVGIAGGDGEPRVITYRNGDNALLMARAAGVNTTPGTLLLLKRAGSGGIQTIELDPADTAKLLATPIQQGDLVIIQQTIGGGVTGRSTGLATIEGEVLRPGAYPIVPGATTLFELFQAAGGPTADASLNGAYIEHGESQGSIPRGASTIDPASLVSTSSLTLDDTTRISRDLRMQGGRVSADIDGLIRRGDRSRDVTLRDNDRVVVPANPRHVQILGRVNFPGAVDFVAGATLDYYVDRAGGYTASAKPSRVEVARFGTGVWVSADDAPILAGDIVYVPGERDTPARTSLEVAQTVIGITSGLVSIASTLFFIIRELNRN